MRINYFLLLLVILSPGMFLTQQACGQTLKDGVKKGLAQSPAVRKAIAEATRSCHELTEVQAATKPQIGLTTSAGAAFRDRTIDGISITSGDTLLSRDARFTVRQTLFDFGTNRILVESAELRKQFQELLLEDVKEQQARLIAETYLEVFKYRLQSNTMKVHLSDISKVLKDAKALEEVEGRDDVVVLESRLIAAKSKLAEILGKLKGFDSRFKLLTCMEIDSSMQLTKMPTCICDHIEIMDSPRVRAADLAVQVSEANVQAARKNKLPKIFFDGRTGIGENVSGIDGSDNEWSALLTMKWTAYDGGKGKAVIAQNMAELDKDNASKDDVILSIKDAIAQNQAELDGAVERRAKLLQALAKIREAVDLYVDKMEADEKGVTLIGLADKHREVFALEIEAIDALISSYMAAIRGLESAGGLLSYLGIDCE